MEATQVAKKCSVGQRPSVCGRIDEGTKQNVGDWDETVNSILPPNEQNEQTNWVNKPRTGTIP